MQKMDRNGSLLFTTPQLVVLALLTALQVVLGNLLQVPLMGKQFSFGFLPLAAAGAMLGVPGGLIVGALGDFIGAHLFPAGAYFPGFTLTNALVGILYALPLYHRKPSAPRVIIAVVLATVVNLFLNSLWLSILYGSKTYWGWITARAGTYLVEAPVQMVVMFLFLQALGRLKLPPSVQLWKE